MLRKHFFSSQLPEVIILKIDLENELIAEKEEKYDIDEDGNPIIRIWF